MKRYFYVLFFILAFYSCSPSVSVTSSWKNPEPSTADKTYKSVFISALTGDLKAKSTVETQLASAAVSKGYKAVKSIDLFPGNLKEVPDKSMVLNKIKELGCDAIFTVALVNKESETRYVPGSTYAPYPARGYYGSYWGYHSYWYQSMYSTPGYYTTDKTYFIESNLYDAATEKILWSAQSKTVNPSNLETISEKYTKAIVNKLEQDGLFKN